MNTVCCWLWQDDHAMRGRAFAPEHVNQLQRCLARHMPSAFRFVCIADRSDGFANNVEFMETPKAAKLAGVTRTPEGPHFPSCYRRLWNFSEEAKVLGDRVLCIDIDLVAVRSLERIFARQEEFVGWRPYRDWGQPLRFGGGIYLLTPGARTSVWTDFKGEESARDARHAGFRGSDQAWISYKLANREKYWDKTAGIYSVRDLDKTTLALPTDAALVQFNGHTKPWQCTVGWVMSNWNVK